MALPMPSPDDLIGCEEWFKKSLLIHAKAEQALCEELCVDRKGLQQALLTTRVKGISPACRHALSMFHQAEIDLFKADQLLELAQELIMSLKQCDQDHELLEC